MRYPLLSLLLLFPLVAAAQTAEDYQRQVQVQLEKIREVLFGPERSEELSVQEWIWDQPRSQIDPQRYGHMTCNELYAERRELYAQTYSYSPHWWSNRANAVAVPLGTMYSIFWYTLPVTALLEVKDDWRQARIGRKLDQIRRYSADRNCFIP